MVTFNWGAMAINGYKRVVTGLEDCVPYEWACVSPYTCNLTNAAELQKGSKYSTELIPFSP